MKRVLIVLALAATPLFAGEPSPVEDHNFFAESGRNRDDAVLQYTTFFLAGRNAAAYELTQEWAAPTTKHQLSYTIPLFSDGKTGLGDVKLNYRYQLFGGAESRIAVAPRVSLVLPTRAAHFGERSSGVEAALPVSAALSNRVALHANAVATWFRDRHEHELKLTQSLTCDVTSRIALAVESDYTHGGALIVRPGVQFAFEGPAGMRIAPGVAMPLGTDAVLVYVAVEHGLRRR